MVEAWAVVASIDPITDQRNISFILEAEQPGRWGHPALVIRCRNGNLEALIDPKDFLGSDNRRIAIRFGTDPPTQEIWSEAAGHTALFVPGNRVLAELFVRKLAKYDRFVAQVTPYNRAPVSMVFQLAGIDKVSQELLEVCGPNEP